LIAQLNSGVTVITPNERAARRVRRLYDQYQQQQGVAVWASAKAMSLASWLKRTWNDAVTEGRIVSPVLISKEHSFALWEQIIRTSPASQDILNISGTAEMAQSAYELMLLYQVPGKGLSPLDTSESRAFHQWSTQYQKRLDKEKWVDESALLPSISNALTEKSLSAPAAFCLYAMEDLRPVEMSLMEALRVSGSAITEFAAPMVESSPRKLQCVDVEQEIEYAAQCARKRLIEDPTTRIGVIVPQLPGLRQKI